jgi:predicted RNA-binding Zn-ribbon protein involved in translation (DUF1610 family)
VVRYYDGPDDDYGYDEIEFADPGGRSALRAEVGGGNKCPGCKRRTGAKWDFCAHCGQQLNPRKHPCPTCGQPEVLTNEDIARHYQCDRCADRAEGIYVGADY